MAMTQLYVAQAHEQVFGGLREMLMWMSLDEEWGREVRDVNSYYDLDPREHVLAAPEDRAAHDRGGAIQAVSPMPQGQPTSRTGVPDGGERVKASAATGSFAVRSLNLISTPSSNDDAPSA